jgi:hypothetical protein
MYLMYLPRPRAPRPICISPAKGKMVRITGSAREMEVKAQFSRTSNSTTSVSSIGSNRPKETSQFLAHEIILHKEEISREKRKNYIGPIGVRMALRPSHLRAW